MLTLELLDPIDGLIDGLVQLDCAQAQVEDVRVVATADHALLELGAILRDDILDVLLPLQICSHVECLSHNFIRTEVPDSFVKKRVLSAHLYDIVDEAGISAFELGCKTAG